MATPVRIVRPNVTFHQFVSDLLASLTLLAIRAWVVMLAAPLVGFYPGYWMTVGLVYAVRCLIAGEEHRLWTSDK